MTITKNLLVELLVEELPPKSLKKLGEAFAEGLASSLKTQGVATSDAIVTAYASPRRLAVHITGVAAQSADKPVSQKLMPVAVGLDTKGQPTPALLKKLASIGVDALVVPRLKRENDGKAEMLVLDRIEKGMSLTLCLNKALWDTLPNLPIAKVMTYQLRDGWSTVDFVRPAHGLVAMYGATALKDVRILGLEASNQTQGHRFEAGTDPIVIKNADSYELQMEKEGAVIPNFEKRRDEIVRQITAASAKEKLTPVGDEDLLNEVTALVERPNVLIGTFEKEFLEVPQECLILTMKANQKYFPLLNSKGKLTNRFLIISNIRQKDASLVVGGNERVVRPRLADAKFFFDKDRKQPLDSRVLGLAKVVYHNMLGSQGERVERLQAIARTIGQQLGGESLALQADQAALLVKADLLTDMVGEFPELQGIMGRYYAQHDGLSDDIAYAIEDHYKPRFAGDELPRNMAGICVALADKLETLVGMFGIGEIPTGDRDPFALRRHALGVIRMLIEKELLLDLDKLIEQTVPVFLDVSIYAELHKKIDAEEIARRQRQNPGAEISYGRAWVHPPMSADNIVVLTNFIYDRLSGYLHDQGYSSQEVDAVLSLRPKQLREVTKRLAAVRAFAALPEAGVLAAANKRVGNILKKEGIVANAETVNSALLKEPAEKALHLSLGMIAPKADSAFAARDYTTSLQTLAALREPVDAFFDNVMVNAEDSALRANRLALLSQLHQAMNRVADISKLAT
jgi:glycyl-tRNA synthetase beta chain